MDWLPIDYNPQDRIDPEWALCAYKVITDVRERVHLTCSVNQTVELAFVMYTQIEGRWYRSREPLTWFERRKQVKGY